MIFLNSYLFIFNFLACIFTISCEEIFGCGGFVKSNFSINYSRVDIKLYTKQGSLKYQTDCAPNNGYYLIPLYDKGDYVLKIEPPSGWSFEPDTVALHVDGISDPCSRNQDINFIFKGFSITGKVLSVGRTDGPSNIKLTLKKTDSDEFVQETYSQLGGTYSFSSVFPGSYIIEASHKTWQFSVNVERIKIEQDNAETQKKIHVSGFDVHGHVFSEGEPIQGVHFLLFSKSKLKEIPSGCRIESIKGFNVKKELHYICHVTSLSDGSFVFPSIPSGTYKLIPFHKGEHIEFDVSPPEVDFEVMQDSFEFGDKFQVEGFSVTGRVLEVENGNGVDGAEIYINDKRHTVTNQNGIYHLENMRAGMYELKVKTTHIYFDVVTVKVTPNTPQLPEIYASKFSVCGRVHIENFPAGISQPKRVVALVSAEEDSYTNVPVREDGSFCTIVSPGSYIVEPVISEIEKNAGLQFSPPTQKIQLTHFPLLDVSFSQFLATLKGHIKCIEKHCNNLPVKVISILDETFFFETTTSDDGKFEIKGCLPGKYVLTTEKDSWCFQSKKVEFTIANKDIPDLILRQSGFQASVKLSHPSSFKVKYPSGEIHSVHLEKATNVLCLPESGIYDLIPVGCHLYKSDTFKLDTNKPAEIDIQATKHLVTGNVLTEVNVSDIKVSIHRHTSVTPDIIPLKEPVELKDNIFRYVFSIFVEPKTELDVKVSSLQLLFRPTVAHISVLDECIDNAVELTGKKGLFIDGAVTPVIEDVKMIVLDKISNSKLSQVFTDKSGKFKVGPLDDELEYIVIAEKEGYFFTPQGSVGNFQAFKLAEILVEVTSDEDNSSLPGVLLSLSGGVDYRKNSLSQKNGKVSFMGLNPGQYFLRPMLKEFQFHPPTKMIDIKEGTQVKIRISGKRVAFSLFGVVNSLTSEAEVGVAVEAVGIESDDCLQYQEEAISEQGGTFRIRGLQPRCQYNLRLKKGSDVNQHIERTTPEEMLVNVTDGDITNVRIIAFRHFGQLDVSGTVSSNEEYLQTLKIRLVCEDNPDQILQTVNLGHSRFFFLPSMPIDNRMYTIRLDSSLPTSSYAYKTPSISFIANTSFYHFSFSFNPRPKLHDQETSQGSFLTLPIALLCAVIVYYYEKCLAFILNSWQSVNNVLAANTSDASSSDGSGTRRKVKARKLL